MAAKKEKPLKYVSATQSLIPIREIRDGIIITSDNRYIKLMEILPINFLLKSPSEQNEIAYMFRKMFKSGPVSMQFKVVTRNANMARHLQILGQEMLTEPSVKCYEMQKEYAKMLKNVGSEEGVSRRFFLSFEYEHEGNILHKATWSEIKGQLYTVASRIESALIDCGNEVVQVDDENEQALEILYYILNSRKSMNISFETTQSKVIKRYLKHSDIPEDEWEDTLPYVPPTDLIAPKRVEFPSKSYMVIDGRYYIFAYIPSAGYNSAVLTGWISPLINAGEGFDIDLYFNRVPREQVIFKIRQSLNQNRALLHDTSDTQSSFDALEESVQAGLYLKDGLANGEDFYYMATFVTVSGTTLAEAEWKLNEFKKMLSTMDISIKKCTYEVDAAFKSTLPLCSIDPGLWKKAKRNALTSGVASTYPFTSFEMCDEDGILLGRNMTNNSLAIINIFNTKIYKNANMFIAGCTGAGKTFSLLLLAIRMRLKHIPVIIIAPEKEHEFERVCTAMDGQFIRFGSGSPHCINIMDIFQTDDTVARILDGGGIISSRLEEKVQDLKTFFKLLIPDINYEEKELLDEALMSAYAKKGITRDNDSLFDENDPTRYKEMPILGDLYSELESIPKAGRIATIIKTLVTGSGASFNEHTNVNLNNEFVVLGLEHLNDDLLPIGMYMAIDYAWSKIKEDRTKRKTMFIDEWWRFAFDPIAADYSLKIAKTIRAYGGSVCFATQQMTDIFAIERGKYGEGVLNNCKTKIIMQLEEADAANVKQILRLTETEKAKLTRFKQGEALLVANNNSVVIKFEANKTEFDLITTDRKELEKQVFEKMSELEKKQYLAKKHKEVEELITAQELELMYLDEEDEEDEWNSAGEDDVLYLDDM